MRRSNSVANRLYDSFSQAVMSLRENRLRTALSILGIAVGIASVMTVGTIGSSGREYVFNELRTFGLNSIWIYRNWNQDNPFASVAKGSGITSDDVETIINSDCCAAVKRVSPQVWHDPWKVLVRMGGNYRKIPVEGVGPDYLAMNNDETAMGRELRPDDVDSRKPVAIIGPKVHETLFGLHQSPLGKTVRIENLKLTVIGVLKYKNRSFLSSIGAVGYDTNDRIIIPYTLYQQQLGSKNVQQIQAEAYSEDLVDDAVVQIVNLLNRRHNGKFQYVQETMKSWIATANRIIGVITTIGVVTASVSLLVGGLGIMNIMSTAVMERTREIGIRKAVGARNADILSQFLLEALVISAIGGVLGMGLGFFVLFVFSSISGFPLQPSWWMLVIAVVVSAAVGVVSGYYPARRAAMLKPVDALRYE